MNFADVDVFLSPYFAIIKLEHVTILVRNYDLTVELASPSERKSIFSSSDIPIDFHLDWNSEKREITEQRLSKF